MTENHYNQNQTQFIAEEPILAAPAPVVPESITPVPPVKQRPKWLWWAAGILVILLIIVLAVALRRSAVTTLTDQTTQSAEDQRPLTPLELRLQTARELLRGANPTNQELPFPPLDLTLRIDDP